MTFWVALLTAATVQDQPAPPPPPPIKIEILPARPAPAPAPAPAPGQDRSPKCDTKCHDKFQACPAIARMCESCGNDTTVCGAHARLCKTCADQKQVCPYCQRPLGTSRDAARSRVQAELDKSMPGHRAGREVPSELSKKLLPNVAIFMILHSGSPCQSCPKYLECLGVVEYKDDKDGEGKVALLKTEDELSELLKRQKLSGREDAARLAAELVQALWTPLRGSLKAVEGDKRVDPEKVALEKDGEGFKAVFEYKKGNAFWTAVVTLDKEGALAGIAVSDMGRATRE